jgi:hypothetical protein
MVVMLRFLFASIVLFSSMSLATGQDIITKKSGEDIQAKIIEVTSTEVKFRRFDNLNGPIFSMFKSEVLIIRYENGTKDIFTEAPTNKPESTGSGGDMRARGKQDANVHYKGRNSGAVWTGVTSVLFTPFIGLIPAGVCASAEPSDENLNYPDPDLMKDNSYNQGFSQQAHKKKRRKVWSGFGVGSGIWLLLVILL